MEETLPSLTRPTTDPITGIDPFDCSDEDFRAWAGVHYFDMSFPSDMDEDEPNPEPNNTAESLQPSYAPWSPTWATASTTDTDEEINDPHVDQVNDLPTGDTIYFGVNNLHDIIPVELPADSPLLTAEHHELVNAVLKIHYEMLRAQSHANAWDVLGGEVH